MATPSGADAGAPVLVVEDDPDVQQVIRWALEDAGLPVVAAADGWHALELALLRQPALVILDLGLPRLDGADGVAGLQMARKAEIPILLVSGDRRLAEKAEQLGAYAYLRKPFDVEALVAAARRGLVAALGVEPREVDEFRGTIEAAKQPVRRRPTRRSLG